MKTGTTVRAGVFALAAMLAGCAHQARTGPSPDMRSASDPWLRARSDADCQQQFGCLFAIVEDSSRSPLSGADVELSGTSVHVTSNNQGRISAQNIPLGSHRIRVLANGETLESDPVAFGMTIQTLTVIVSPGHLRIVR